MKASLIFGIFLALALSACTKDAPEKEVAASVEANQEAESQLEWDQSTVKPEALFERWRTEKKSPESVCRALNGLSGQDLSLFENEISTNQENAGLLAPCKADLQKKLEAYWDSVRPK